MPLICKMTDDYPYLCGNARGYVETCQDLGIDLELCYPRAPWHHEEDGYMECVKGKYGRSNSTTFTKGNDVG